jgi:dihydropteroate synthase
MKAALAAGARIVNDVTALGDPDSRRVVAEAGVPVILMHMQGEPGTMQIDPHYDAVALDVFDALDARVRAAVEAGIPRERILVDPGIGFGKTLEHNVALIAILDLLRLTGAGILLGVSRKRFLSSLAGGGGVEDRLPGSLAAGLAGIARGADVLRVHDVRETKRALAVALAIDRAP